jgi:fructose-specific phosphotransferase system IIA component
MALLDLVTPEIVKIPLDSTTKDAVIRELIGVLVDAGQISDQQAVYDAVLAREALGSTGLEAGIAVPHAKTDSVSELTIAIGISPAGLDYEALDGEPSRLFFLMLAPPDQSGPHIEALAEIARATRSKAFCRALLSSETPDEVVELFREG